MARSKKLVLSLDPVPSRAVTGRERRPRASRAPRQNRSTSARSDNQKRRRNETPPSQTNDEEPIRAKKPNVKSEGKIGLKTEYDRRPPKFEQVVAIDPGMSGSGMSFASVKSDPSTVVAEMIWPGIHGRFEKVPSIVAMYEDNLNHQDFENGAIPSFFGFEVPQRSTSRAFYKVSLDRGATVSTFDDPILASNTSTKLVRIEDPVRNINAFRVSLKHLREIHLRKASDALGEMVENTRFVYVFTYPAACSPQGIQALQNLVREAGFSDDMNNRPEFLSEAHAAAMAGFIGCRTQHGSQAWQIYFKENTLVTVIDLGALTVDLTTVRIKSNDPKLILAEATVPSGGKCGTAAIHCRIMKVFADKFGDAFAELPSEVLGRDSAFFRDCERHLRTFDPTRPHKRYRVSLDLPEGTVHPDYDEDAEEALISSAEIKSAVDASLEFSKALLLNQWTQNKKDEHGYFHEEDVQTTMFCGGGSLIPYVYNELGAFCSQNGIQHMRARDPESTVCRGAVISRLREDLYGKRLYRASFGIEVQQNGRNHINWFVDQGDDLDTSQQVVIKEIAGHVYMTYREILDPQQRFEMPVLMYEGGGSNPTSANDPGVQKILDNSYQPRYYDQVPQR